MDIDTAKIKKMAEDTVEHKIIVLRVCLKLFEYYVDNGNAALGISLLRRACTHDNSKFSGEEFRKLASIIDSNPNCFRDASAGLSEKETDAIKEHWKNNRHHPEYFDEYSNMLDLDMLEMVCDWYARSLQFGTDFIPFIIERQHNRFKFSPEQFDKILEMCKLVQSVCEDKPK